MSSFNCAALRASCLLFLISTCCFARAQSSSKTVLVEPTAEEANAAQQQLVLDGVKASPETIGVRVFLNPTPNAKPEINDKSYLGTLYFSHSKEGVKEGDFVLSLSTKITKRSRVVIYPISEKGTPVTTELQVRDVKLKPMDNEAFK